MTQAAGAEVAVSAVALSARMISLTSPAVASDEVP